MNIYPFQPLDEVNLSDLKVALKGFLQKGETIKLETKVRCKYIRNIQITILQLVLLQRNISKGETNQFSELTVM